MVSPKHYPCLALVAIVMLLTREASAVLQCNQVTSGLVSCVPYLQSGGYGIVSQDCCTGISQLYQAAQTTPDRQAICRCLKQAAAAFPTLNIRLAASIPGKCGFNIPYKLDPNTDCNRVQ